MVAAVPVPDVRTSAFIDPFTSNVADGLATPIPTFPFP
jgi:hypothetical protein